MLDIENNPKIGFARPGNDLAVIIITAPQCADSILSKPKLAHALTRGCTADHLAQIIKIAPHSAHTCFFSVENQHSSCAKLENGTQYADILTTVPELFPILYPYCYLLKKPEDMARVMALVSIDTHRDKIAKLPAIHGLITWPAGFLPISNTLLNQLMYCLSSIKTVHSRLVQATLLIKFAEYLELSFVNADCDTDALGIFKQIKKCHHDALTLLTPVIYRKPQLTQLITHFLMDIEALNSFHGAFTDQKCYPNLSTFLRKGIKYENYRLHQHLDQFRKMLNTKSFSDIAESRAQFNAMDNTLFANQQHTSLWRSWRRELLLAQQDENITDTRSMKC